MINLIIHGGENPFENNSIVLDRSRALTEYILPEYREVFSKLNDDAISKIKEIPCIFAQESWCKSDAFNGNVSKHNLLLLGAFELIFAIIRLPL